MSLTTDNIIQQNTGSFESTSGTVSLGAGTTAGSFIVVCAAVDGDAVSTWTLAMDTEGFTRLTPAPNGITACKPYVFGKRNIAADVTSWTLTVEGTSQQVVWAVFELTGAGLDPYDTALFHAGPDGWHDRPENFSGSDTATTSRSTGTTQGTPCYDTLSFAVHACGRSDTTVPTISGHTNSYVEIASVSRTNAGSALKMSVSAVSSIVVGTTECTATISPSSPTYATVATLYADGAKFAPTVANMTGYEFGTATGLTATSATQPSLANFDLSAGSPEIVTDHPRSGSYCLKLSSTSAAEYAAWHRPASGSGSLSLNLANNYDVAVKVTNIYFESLPAGDLPLFSFEVGTSSNSVVFWYRSASQKIGCKVGTGTEQLSDATVGTGHWIGIHYRYDPRTTTHTCDWQVDYNSDTSDTTAPVAQTQASNTGMTAYQSGSQLIVERRGWADSRTATVFYDDEMLATHWGSYPLGDIRIVAKGPDQAGTPTISGTSGNFRTFTSNGTLAAWTATATRTALDDIPPIIGPSAAGLAQTTAASNDYCEIPMDTFTFAPNFVPRAVKWYAVPWAASGTAATLQMAFLDVDDPFGGSPVVVIGDHGQDDTALIWFCRMHNPGSGKYYELTQARVDGLKARFGYSTDATPDVGLHTVFYELAYCPATVFGGIEMEDGAFTLYVRQDPNSGAIASLLGTTPAGTRGATMTFTIDGTPGTQYINPNTTGEKSIGAATAANVTAYGLQPDPTT